MLSLLYLSFASIFPVFGWIFVGALLIRIFPTLQAAFRRGEKFVFFLGIPGILFITASRIEPAAAFSSNHTLAGIIATVCCVAGSWQIAKWRGHTLEQRGIVAQAGFRANLAIIGLALCASTFGEEGLALAALPVAVWTLIFNVLAVFVLNAAYGGQFAALPLAIALLKNPLIIGICLGFGAALLALPIPQAIYQGGSYFTAAVIPLSLILLGGAIDLKPSRESRKATRLACLLRLLIAPLLSILIALLMGVRNMELGIYFLLLSGPVAAASHIMVTAKGGDGKLSANIVVLSTVLAPLTMTLGFFLLKVLALV
ncbi:AEC family transporter [Litorivivens sp.]|uniref:AEC family transporter n=1 Tax=Litorivivens sp. TaxID=2020868 RepID=UPI0035694756